VSLDLSRRRIGAAFGTPVARSLISSAIVGILSILFCLSYAALIFAGPLAPFLAYGIAATFITSAIGGALLAWRSSLLTYVIGVMAERLSYASRVIGVLQR